MAQGLISISAPIIQAVHGARQHAPRVAGNDVLNIAAPALCISTYLHIPISTYPYIYLSTYLPAAVKTGTVAGGWSAPIFLSAAALLRTECDQVPPPLAFLHTANPGSRLKHGIRVDKWRDVAAMELSARDSCNHG